MFKNAFSNCTKIIRVSYKSKRSFFPWSKKNDTDNKTALEEVIKRKEIPGEDTNIKQNLNFLGAKKKLTNKKGYTPPEDVDEKTQVIVEQICGVKGDAWQDVALTDRRVKFKVLSKMIDEFNKDIPPSTLSQINTVSEALQHFQTYVKETTALEDIAKTKLPKNLHIELEYNKFDPETDTMFQGRTAFPGSDTIVSSIKYKRKYKGTKTTYEKAGYVNHYENY